MLLLNYDNLKFIRYGGLSPVKQVGHSAPARRGIYAFAYPFMDHFFLSGDHNLPWLGGKKVYMRDKNRRIVDEDHPDFEELIAWDRCVTYGKSVVSAPSHGKIFVEVHPKTQKLVCMILPRPRVFCHYGSLWTVMEPNYQAQKYHVDPESAKCWWYVDIDQFVDLCKKLIVDTAKDSHRVAKATGIKFVEFTKNWYRFRGADPFEVFIERIVSRRM